MLKFRLLLFINSFGKEQLYIKIKFTLKKHIHISQLNLAVCECECGNLDKSLPIYQQCLKIYKQVYGEDSQQANRALRNIALLL